MQTSSTSLNKHWIADPKLKTNLQKDKGNPLDMLDEPANEGYTRNIEANMVETLPNLYTATKTELDTFLEGVIQKYEGTQNKFWWSPREDEILLRLAGKVPIDIISKILNRSTDSIMSRARYMRKSGHSIKMGFRP